MFGHFFEQDRISIQKLMYPKSDDFFFLALTVRGPIHRKNFE